MQVLSQPKTPPRHSRANGSPLFTIVIDSHLRGNDAIKGIFMNIQPAKLFVSIFVLLTFSSSALAQDNRYYNIQQATHISAGWVAYSNGELYQCRFSATKAPSCVQATGLPSSMQTVSLLWADGDEAWVSYTDGLVYGCRSKGKNAPRCLVASGLP